MKTACVVGSGPSGAACAFGLLQAGIEVTMLDVGFELEDSLRPLTYNTAAVDSERFLQEVWRHRKRTVPPQSIPAKRPFGSDYAYRPLAATRIDLAKGTQFVCSLARGGLSNAWGANVCGLVPHDCDDWPIGAAELDPYFARLAHLVDIAGNADDALGELSRTPLTQRESFPLGLQGRHVLVHMYENAERLKGWGLYCGRAKLAVGRRYATNGEGCVSCGLCMHGCPYNAIFSATDVIGELRRDPAFHYLPGQLVKTFRESDDRATVCVENVASGGATELSFDRLYLACGVVGTTAIVARSLGLCEHVFEIKDSTKYLFLFATNRRIHGAMRRPANTLSQVFLQSVRQTSTPRTVHGQLYGYNDLILDPLRRVLGDLAFTLAPLGALALERLMIGMVYFHSDDSGVLRFEVNPDAGRAGLGRIQGEESEHSRAVFDEFMGRLVAARHQLGGRPLPWLAKKNPPGLSQHFGGSLPMKRDPDKWSTDIYGRPWGCDRTHCVDSSVLPSIPATPTALLLMANALRIADASRLLAPRRPAR